MKWCNMPAMLPAVTCMREHSTAVLLCVLLWGTSAKTGRQTGKQIGVCYTVAEPVEPLLHHVISVQGTVDTSKWYTGEVVGYDGIMHTGDWLWLTGSMHIRGSHCHLAGGNHSSTTAVGCW